MRPKYIVIGLGILLCSMSMYWLWFASWRYSDPNAVSTTSELTQEEVNDLYLKSAMDGRRDAIASIGDPAFSAYVYDVLDKRCPFYESGGAVYRDCLWGVVNESEAAYKKSSPTTKEIDDSCQALASNLDGLLSGEIILSCRTYKLSIN